MHQYFALILLIFPAISYTQNVPTAIGMPPTDSLINSLEIYHQNLLKSQLAEFQISEKGAWLKYIPSVGVGYSLGTDGDGNLTNVLRPSLSYSTNVIYQVRQDSENRRAKTAAINQAAALELENRKLELILLIKQYQNEVEELELMQQLNDIDTELYAIATVQFNSTEMAPSAYLPKKRAYLQKQFELFQKEKLLRNLKSNVLLIAHYN